MPGKVAPETLPSAWRVGAFLDGTLIVTQRDFFNINDNPEAIARANAVEHEMTEAGLLPRLMDLIRGATVCNRIPSFPTPAFPL